MMIIVYCLSVIIMIEQTIIIVDDFLCVLFLSRGRWPKLLLTNAVIDFGVIIIIIIVAVVRRHHHYNRDHHGFCRWPLSVSQQQLSVIYSTVPRTHVHT